MSRLLLAAILTLLWIRPRASATLFVDIGVLILLYLAWPVLADLAWSAGDALATRFERWWDERGYGVIEDDRAQACVYPLWSTVLVVLAVALWILAEVVWF